MLSKVNKITTAEIAKFYIKQAEASGLDTALPGVLTFVQRSGSALAANLHLHILQLEGVFSPPEINGETPLQHALSGPTDEDVATTVEQIAKRPVKWLRCCVAAATSTARVRSSCALMPMICLKITPL